MHVCCKTKAKLRIKLILTPVIDNHSLRLQSVNWITTAGKVELVRYALKRVGTQRVNKEVVGRAMACWPAYQLT